MPVLICETILIRLSGNGVMSAITQVPLYNDQKHENLLFLKIIFRQRQTTKIYQHILVEWNFKNLNTVDKTLVFHHGANRGENGIVYE